MGLGLKLIFTTEFFCHCRGIYWAKMEHHIKFWLSRLKNGFYRASPDLEIPDAPYCSWFLLFSSFILDLVVSIITLPVFSGFFESKVQMCRLDRESFLDEVVPVSASRDI